MGKRDAMGLMRKVRQKRRARAESAHRDDETGVGQ
jgi:hypothetical protein